ncbi:hypothetical protein DID88_000303 [Monilinia fructigena]|uniref:Uncharacterized protein n=1 Tax=Monilinia fructigena TaxID=38457 RepID=A0A395IHI0_9HELO|nr:hypothetical protein DID88_000303 [Monilinia fructigena]
MPASQAPTSKPPTNSSPNKSTNSKTAAQSHTQQIAVLKQQVEQTPDPQSQASLHMRELEQQLTQLTSDLDFKNELASQAVRTHALEKSALDQQIAYLRTQLRDREVIVEETSRLVDEVRELRDRVLDKEDEVESLKVEHAEVVKRLEGEVRMLRGAGRKKDLGLERMGVLVAGGR